MVALHDYTMCKLRIRILCVGCIFVLNNVIILCLKKPVGTPAVTPISKKSAAETNGETPKNNNSFNKNKKNVSKPQSYSMFNDKKLEFKTFTERY